MNKKLLTGAALAAAGVAATYLLRKKRNSSSMTSNTSSPTSQGRGSKHMTDVFSNAKTSTQTQAWSPARDESL